MVRESDEVAEALFSGFPPLERETIKVGGKLTLYYNAWKKLGASFWQMRTVKRGLAWTFHTKPVLTNTPLFFSVNTKERQEIMQSHIDTMLKKGAIESVSDPNTPGFYSLMFLKPKKSGELRPIIDLSTLNLCITCPTFKMETAQSIRSVLTKGQWVASLDMKDAYFHIPIRKSFRKYLRFAFMDKIWQFCACPFGLSVAPWAFTGVMSLVGSICHQKGIQIHLYLDDWLLRADSREVLRKHVNIVTKLMTTLGLTINLEKSETTPTQNLTFLGYVYDLKHGTVHPTEENIQKVVTKAQTILKMEKATARDWLSFIGNANAIAPITPLGRLLICPLDMYVHNVWSWTDENPTIMNTLIPTIPELTNTLRWWTQPKLWNKGVLLRQFTPQLHLFTDASCHGWGAHMGTLTTSGVWTKQESVQHINVLECIAVHRALMNFSSVTKGKSVLIATDNTTTLAYINRSGGTRSPEMFEVTKNLLLWCNNQAIILRATHIKGSLNVMADLLSRRQKTVQTEWSLHPEIVTRIWEKWFKPDIDLFATRFNHKLPKFISPFPDPLAHGLDAMTMDWNNLYLYAFPPFALVNQVMRKFEQTARCQLILVAPFWPTRNWFGTLIKYSKGDPLELPKWKKLLKQPVQETFHENLQLLNLHAWHLSKED